MGFKYEDTYNDNTMDIEILTIVKTSDEVGNINYLVSGSLSLDEAARALVIVAFKTQPPTENKPISKAEETCTQISK